MTKKFHFFKLFPLSLSSLGSHLVSLVVLTQSSTSDCGAYRQILGACWRIAYFPSAAYTWLMSTRDYNWTIAAPRIEIRA